MTTAPQAFSMAIPSSSLMQSVQPPAPQGRKCCSPKYLCPTVETSCGVGSSVLSLATGVAGTVLGNPICLYVAIGSAGLTSLIHVIEGISTCILLPKRSLEANVDRAGEEDSKLQTEVSSLQKTVATLESSNQEQKTLLEAERAATATQKAAYESGAKKANELSEELMRVSGQLSASKTLLQKWQEATKEVARQFPQVQTGQLEQGVDAISAQLKGLSITKESFSDQIASIGADTKLISDMQSTWGGMLDRLQSTIGGLADDNVQKRRMLTEAEKNVNGLSSMVSSLQTEIKKLEDQASSEKSSREELVEANRQLQILSEMLKQPEVIKMLEELRSPPPSK